MSESTFNLQDGRVLTVTTEQIEVTSNAPRPDPTWSFTDTHGHVHTHETGTFHCVKDDPAEADFWIDADGEEHNAPEHCECKVCGDPVSPGMRGPSGFREFIPGPTSYLLDGEPVTRERAVAIFEQAPR